MSVIIETLLQCDECGIILGGGDCPPDKTTLSQEFRQIRWMDL